MKPGVYIGLDLGSRHIGVALSSPTADFVFPRASIEVASETAAFKAIEDLVTAEQPVAVILGLPLTMRGDVGPQAAAVESFAERLRPRLSCPVQLQDERLSTQGGRREQPASDDHSQAARLILETFLGISA